MYFGNRLKAQDKSGSGRKANRDSKTDAMTEWSIALIVAVSVILIFLLLARGFVQPARRVPRPRPTATTLGGGNKETSELPESVEPRELADTTV